MTWILVWRSSMNSLQNIWLTGSILQWKLRSGFRHTSKIKFLRGHFIYLFILFFVWFKLYTNVWGRYKCFRTWLLQTFNSAVFFQSLLAEAVSFKQSYAEKHMMVIEFDAKVFSMMIQNMLLWEFYYFFAYWVCLQNLQISLLKIVDSLSNTIIKLFKCNHKTEVNAFC